MSAVGVGVLVLVVIALVGVFLTGMMVGASTDEKLVEAFDAMYEALSTVLAQRDMQVVSMPNETFAEAYKAVAMADAVNATMPRDQ